MQLLPTDTTLVWMFASSPIQLWELQEATARVLHNMSPILFRHIFAFWHQRGFRLIFTFPGKCYMRSPGFFSGEGYLEAKIWALRVLSTWGDSLLLRSLHQQDWLMCFSTYHVQKDKLASKCPLRGHT